HEFTHSWNGKFRRPAGNWTPNFNTPMNDDLLWVYEGQTQLWGYVLAARSGLSTKQEALDALAAVAASLDIRRGRDWRPLRDTTNDPVITARRPKGWVSWQRSEDYYNEGMLVWLEADAIIREKTNGARGLDDFARVFFKGRDGDWGTSTYDFNDVVAALNGVVAYDWAGLLTQRLTETAKGAPLNGFTKGGYRLTYGETPTGAVKDAERTGESVDLVYSLGLSVGKSGKINQVIWDSPAFDKGMTVDDEIVAVNNRAYSGDGIRTAITGAKDGKSPVRLLVKSGDRYRDVTIDYRGGLRYPRFEKIGAGEGSLDKLLSPRS
ncbi:MAG: peptidase M61, partial [Sphingobium sp.]